MKPIDYVILAVLAVIVGLVIFYIVRSKKSGAKCIGCPHSKTCSSCNCGKEK